MLDHLKYIFQNVNDWLRFAEAKNGALIAFNVASFVGILAVGSIQNPVAVALMVISLTSFSISCCILIFSFVPQTSKSTKVSETSYDEIKKKHPDLNLFFFGSLVHLTPAQLVSMLKDFGTSSENSQEKLATDLAGQIITNSEITLRKLKYFWWGGWFSIFGVLMLMTSIITKTILT